MSTTATSRFVRRTTLGGVLAMIALTAGRAARSADDAAPKSESTEQAVEIPAPVYVLLMLARDPAVQSELQLSRDQTDVVADAIAKVDRSLWVLRDVPVPKCAAQLDEHQATLEHELQGALSADQLKRLHEIVMQARGYKALVSPEVSQRLRLSTQTIGRLQPILASNKPADGSTTVDKTTAQQITAILSADQRAELAALVGEPFDLSRVLRIGCVAPEFAGISSWINSDALTLKQLRGRVVVVHFWAFGCINCVRNLPHYQGWFESFPQSQLSIVGIHTPETERERSVDNLRANLVERQIKYPVAFDQDAASWKAWGNNMWPSVYLIDKQGRVRSWWYGELNWQGARGEENMRKKIKELLAEPDTP
jgi:peroxiredoxin